MSKPNLEDLKYPLGENHPDLLHAGSSRAYEQLTLENVISGKLTQDDFSISPETLLMQAEIARKAGRKTLALNFERAAEMVSAPQEMIFETYEMLRPGRASSKSELNELARRWKVEQLAPTIAKYIEEAAEIYESRDLFSKRF